MTVFLLLLSLLEQVVIYNIGMIPSKYIKILNDKDNSAFTVHTATSIVIIIAEAFIKSCISYVASMLYISWRQALCKRLHRIYFTGCLFYHINVVDTTIDNPDQRITQDVDRLTNTFSQVFVPLIISPFTIGYYLYQSTVATGSIGPVSVVIFFIIFSIINKFLMSPVVHNVYQQERREGDFRFKHMQMRVNAESAAFYRASAVEEMKTNQTLGKLISIQSRLIHWEFALNFSINMADYLGSILSYIALAFPIFLGHYDDLGPADLSALISKNGFVSIYLISCFTKLIDLANSMADVAGTAHRIGQLVEVAGRMKAEQQESGTFFADVHSRFCNPGTPEREMQITGPAFKIDSVTYGPPGSSTVLCQNLTLELRSGTNVLVTGDSGSGKTSLLRVLAGLWRPTSGIVHQLVDQGLTGILYLPQKPYLTTGSLRDQIIFPLTEAEVVPEDEKIQRYLGLVGLERLLARQGGLDMDLNWNWYDELSPGEAQRLSFVRLFFHSPPFAMLDEATSQVSQEMETLLYNTCNQLGIGLLSIGHRDSIRQFHQTILHISGNGGWTFTRSQEAASGVDNSFCNFGAGAGAETRHVENEGYNQVVDLNNVE